MNVLSRIGVAAFFVASTLLPMAASAQQWVPYNTYHYYMGGGHDEVTRRSALRDQLFRVSDRVHRADVSGRISHRDARDYYRRMDHVRDLLRNDHHIDRSEYDRWMSDLHDIGRDVRHDARH
jgi:hypothetical protein